MRSIALFLLAAAALAQAPGPRLTESIDVSVVNVDVFVTDRNGQRIRNLSKDDFEIYENGKLQTLTNFSEYIGGQPTQTSEAPAQKRTVVLFVDDIHLSKPDSDAFFHAVRELFHKSIRKGDAAMIASWYANRVDVNQPFTDDVAALDRALDGIEPKVTGAWINEYQDAKEAAEMMRHFELQVTADNREGPQTAVSRPDAAETSWAAEMEGRSRAKKAQTDQETKIAALRTFLRAVAGDEGKKLMLLATHRMSRIAGVEFAFAAGNSPLGVGEHRTEFDASEDLKTIYRSANADGVAIYTMYPEGFREPVSDAAMGSDGRIEIPNGDATGAAELSSQQIGFAIAHNEISALTEIADFTGGRSASGSASANLVRDVEADLDSYYSLGYHAAPGNSEKPRAITVKVKRAGATVRARREYVAKSDTTRMEDRVLSALFRQPPPAPFQVAVVLDPPRIVKQGVMIPVTLRIPIAALTTLPDGRDYAGEFSVYFATGAKTRGASVPTHVTKPFRIPANELQKAKEGYYSYACNLMGDAQTDRIVFGVIDEVSKEFAVSTISFKMALKK